MNYQAKPYNSSFWTADPSPNKEFKLTNIHFLLTMQFNYLIISIQTSYLGNIQNQGTRYRSSTSKEAQIDIPLIQLYQYFRIVQSTTYLIEPQLQFLPLPTQFLNGHHCLQNSQVTTLAKIPGNPGNCELLPTDAIPSTPIKYVFNRDV